LAPLLEITSNWLSCKIPKQSDEVSLLLN